MKCSAKVVGLAAAFLTTGFFVAQFFLHYPEKSDQWAAWVQAIGSIIAIAVAIQVSLWQRTIERQREVNQLRNSIRAIEVELSTHTVGVQVIMDSIERAVARNELNSFTQTKVTFPIYANCASALGEIDDRKVQTAIISHYRFIEVFYEMINDLGEINRKFRGTQEQITDAKGMQASTLRQGKVIVSSDFKAICDGYLRKLPN